MLTLINANRMVPPIAPVGLDYVAGATRRAGIDTELLDPCLCNVPDTSLASYFDRRQPELVGISFRNVDDCFWPSAQSFLPVLKQTVDEVRRLTDAPIVLGGVGFSIFAQRIVEYSGVDFGIRGDGERALVELIEQLRGGRHWDRVDGLIHRQGTALRTNRPAWPAKLEIPHQRDMVDNRTYFQRGGQIGVETKRGCPRKCIYCADPLAKGTSFRLRDPVEVANEVEALLAQKIDVLHLCDAEFNLPRDHAREICDELIRRRLGDRLRWYAYMAVTPLDAELIERLRRAGCVGINFTSDAANPAMLATYGHTHDKNDLARAVRLCRACGIAVMLDMLLGGPGETPESVAESIDHFKRIDPDCVGATLGVRIYPGTSMAARVTRQGPAQANPNIHRHYEGPIDLLWPTFYISSMLGEHPAKMVRELIGDDERFFPPEVDPDDSSGPQDGHNYNENRPLTEALAAGARGAYWDILRKLRMG